MFLDSFLAKSLSLVLFSLLVSCGGGSSSSDSSDDSPITESINSLDDIVGFWDATVEIDGLTDEYYYLITDSGLVTIIDYLGDSFDDSIDCYIIAEDALIFTHLNENEFLSESTFDGSTVSINFFSDGNDLIITDATGAENRLSLTTLSIEEVRSMNCLETISKPNVSNQKLPSENTESKLTTLGRF